MTHQRLDERTAAARRVPGGQARRHASGCGEGRFRHQASPYRGGFGKIDCVEFNANANHSQSYREIFHDPKSYTRAKRGQAASAVHDTQVWRFHSHPPRSEIDPHIKVKNCRNAGDMVLSSFSASILTAGFHPASMDHRSERCYPRVPGPNGRIGPPRAARRRTPECCRPCRVARFSRSQPFPTPCPEPAFLRMWSPLSPIPEVSLVAGGPTPPAGPATPDPGPRPRAPCCMRRLSPAAARGAWRDAAAFSSPPGVTPARPGLEHRPSGRILRPRRGGRPGTPAGRVLGAAYARARKAAQRFGPHRFQAGWPRSPLARRPLGGPPSPPGPGVRLTPCAAGAQACSGRRGSGTGLSPLRRAPRSAGARPPPLAHRPAPGGPAGITHCPVRAGPCRAALDIPAPEGVRSRVGRTPGSAAARLAHPRGPPR